MPGICGWTNTSNSSQPEKTELQAMQRFLPPHYEVEEEAFGDLYSLSCRSLKHGLLHRDDSLAVVIDGQPTTNDNAANALSAANIADLYRKHSDKALDLISGTFAIAIIDIARSRTLLAVDRTGTRPLAYTTNNGTTVFASTSTGVYANSLVTKGLDRQSIYNYVYFHVIPSPRTVFEHVKKLAPAQVLIVENGQTTLKRYWQPEYQREKKGALQGALLPTLRGAVERAADDGKTGGFLSGGLDSSTVCGLLQQSSNKKADAFTIGFAQEGYDELEYARLASGHFGLNLTSYYITPEDVLSAIPEVALAYDEPFGNSSAVPTLVCARMAKAAGVSTLLAGDGGDELFGGNERYSTQKIFGYYRHMPKFLDKSLMRPFFFRDAVKKKDTGFQHKVRRYIEQASMAMPERTQNYNMLQMLGAPAIFSTSFLEHINTDEPIEMLREQYWQDGLPDQLERLLFMDYKFTLADNDLRKVNRMCELAGVTVKYPMLDDQLVSFSHSIPSNVKLKNLELRSYFKNEARNFLPVEIINKTKHGFGLPFGEWLKQDPDLSAHVNQNISNLKERDIFQESFIEDLQERHQNQHAAYYGGIVWVMAMLEEWLQQHNLSV